MRLLPMLLALPLLALQAHAQNAPAQPPAPALTAPVAPPAAAPRHHRMSWKERFAQANITHDGHLTQRQADDGYRTIARHFKEIDADKKGYVTVEDIDNWHKLERAMHRHARNKTDEGLRPRHAMERRREHAREIDTSTDTKVMPMTQPDPSTAGQGNGGTTTVPPRHGT